MAIATLIAAGRLRAGEVSDARDRLAGAGLDVGRVDWIDAGAACDVGFDGDLATARAALEGAIDGVDVVVQSARPSAIRLFVADMDSTMIEVECIDELADYAGLKAEVAAVTERAMRGELDFEAALDARVALLAGLSADTLDQCRRERVTLMPGAQTLVGTLRERGAETLLVSGGFTAFTGPVAEEIGFHRAVANRLGIAGGVLDGSVARPIVDAQRKRTELISARVALGAGPGETMAVGDGANDVPMLREAGLGIAYHAKPIAEAGADGAIRYGDLTSLLHAAGIPMASWSRPPR